MLALALVARPILAGSNDTIPIEAFASPPPMLAPDISPDGKHVVFIDYSASQARVAVMEVDTGRTTQLLGDVIDGYRAQYCRFKGNARVICHFLRFEKAFGSVAAMSRMLAVDIDRSNPKILSQYGNGSQFQDEIIDLLRDDPRNVLVQLFEEHAQAPAVFKQDIYTAVTQRIVRDAPPVFNWSTDRQGVVRFGFGFADTSAFYRARDSESAPWRVLHPKREFERGEFRVLGFSANPDRVIVAAPKDGRVAAWELDLRDSDDPQLLFASPQYELDSPVFWPSDGRIVGFSYQAEKPQLQLFDEQARAVQASLEGLLPGRTVRVVAGSNDGQRLVVATNSDRQPVQFLLLDLAAKSLRPLRRGDSALTADKLVEMKPVSIAAADGRKIPGYLLLPRGASAGKLPTVVLPHGEQFWRDIWEYDNLSQMLANRGYAVLRVNTRGASGYGADWIQAGYRNAGAPMVDDVEAATRWLVSQGIADPQRIGLIGWNMAGYTVLRSAIRDSGLYRCVVSVGGISNLREQVWGRRYFRFGSRIAISLKDDESGRDVSPVRHAAELKAPVLLLHGVLDSFVNVEQSEKFAAALRDAGKSVKLVRIENGDSGLSDPASQLVVLREIEEFLRRNLPPD